jgi:hypothetical protein
LAAADGDAARLRAVTDSLNAALPLDGRPLGYAITGTIRRVLGGAALVVTLGDPMARLAAYQRVAREPSCGCRPLSEALDQTLGLTGAATASSTNSTTTR